MELEAEVAEWLVGDDGLTAVAEATTALDAGTAELPLLTVLRRELDARAAGAVLAAAIARRRARARWPEADRLLFTREALEQASDPAVARWRARRMQGAPVVDLCSGVGGDAIAIARQGTTVTAVDLDAARLVLLRHNAAVMGVRIETRVADALEVSVGPDQLVHVDPARRRAGVRTPDPTQTSPPVDRLLAVHTAAMGIAVVLAPGTDAAHPVLGDDVEVEYVQVGDDLVEAVAWYGAPRQPGARASATIIPRRPLRDDPTGGVLHRTRGAERGPRLPVAEPGDHLVEVAVAAIRARLHDEIGREIGARRIARHRALLTADGQVTPSPWYRTRPVLAVLPLRAANVRRWLAGRPTEPVELVLHGVRGDPTALWREMGRPPRGPGGLRLELVRRDRDQVVIVTRAR